MQSNSLPNGLIFCNSLYFYG